MLLVVCKAYHILKQKPEMGGDHTLACELGVIELVERRHGKDYITLGALEIYFEIQEKRPTLQHLRGTAQVITHNVLSRRAT